MVDTSGTRAYTSWWQARSDTWSRLEEASGQLAATVLAGQADEELAEATSGLLDALAPVERYWAFPGPETLGRVRDLFAAASYGRFALLVARITRALVTESYRSGIGWSLADASRAPPRARCAPAPGSAHRRPAPRSTAEWPGRDRPARPPHPRLPPRRGQRRQVTTRRRTGRTR